MAKIMVAMSGGVDSSVAAALMVEAGHDVMGVTLKLWGGESDSGCCSVSDVDDARRVAQQLGIAHHVFNFGDDFDRHVVEPYVADHVRGRTPNPCVECNRHIKFARLLERCRVLGQERLVTGHHVRLVETAAGRRLARSVDETKDQSYVLHMISAADLDSCEFPLGDMTKADVRAHALRLGLRTANKPDSQDVCFVTKSDGRASFIGRRAELHEGELVDASGATVGSVADVELVTIGQRRGLDLGGSTERRYAVEVDVPKRRVRVGGADELLCDGLRLEAATWVGDPPSGVVMVQTSAHGRRSAAVVDGNDLRWVERQRRVAPGQSVVIYRDEPGVGEVVLGGAIAGATFSEPPADFDEL